MVPKMGGLVSKMNKIRPHVQDEPHVTEDGAKMQALVSQMGRDAVQNG